MPAVTKTTVAKASEMSDGDIRQVKAAGRTLALFGVAAAVYAIDDTCPHRGCPLSDGDLDGTTITCSCHGSQFDVRTGTLLRGPATAPVQSYPVAIEGGDVRIDV